MAKARRYARQASYEQLDRVLTAELGPIDPRTRRGRLAAIDAVVSGETWDLLRSTHGLTPEEARLAVANAVRALVPGAQPEASQAVPSGPTDEDRTREEAAQRVLAGVEQKIGRLVAAIEAGSPADLLAPRLRALRAAKLSPERDLADTRCGRPPTGGERWGLEDPVLPPVALLYLRLVDGLADSVDRIAADIGFSGVVRVDHGETVAVAQAYGLAHRGCETPNTVDCRFAIASGTKGLTALTVVSLIDERRLESATTARSVLGEDLPLIGDDVTVEQLLAHRSGIGDYVDEDTDRDITDHVLPVPVHELATTERYLRVLDGHAATSAPGERFSYCNSGYVVLALIAERTTGTSFPDLVEQRVCAPAGMHDTAFLRSDELPGRAAVGYLAADGTRTNVFHLPVRGSGDGGIYSTAADIHAMWAAIFAGRIVSPDRVADMVGPRSDVTSESMRYGLGFWLHESNDAVMLEGFDAGVSFRSVHDPARGLTHTVLSNTSHGAWPITRYLDELLDV